MEDAPTYLLFDGSSPDGMGEPKYIGRTDDAEKARAHLVACRSDPYSTGRLIMLTDTVFRLVWSIQDFDRR